MEQRPGLRVAGEPMEEDPTVVEDPADERPSRRGIVTAVVVVAASAAATGLLLSGWTPGPSAPPQNAAPVSTNAPAAAPKAAPRTRTTPTRTTAPATQRTISAQLFAGQCGVCHTLAAAGTSGRIGPNLDVLRPSVGRVLKAISVGGRGTGLMPRDILTGRDAARVARFVAGSARR